MIQVDTYPVNSLNNDINLKDSQASSTIKKKKPLPKIPVDRSGTRKSTSCSLHNVPWSKDEEKEKEVHLTHHQSYPNFHHPLLLTQPIHDDYYPPYYQYTYYQTPPPLPSPQPQYGNTEWKVSMQPKRSNSLKIDTDHLNTPISSHLEKPYEPPMEEKAGYFISSSSSSESLSTPPSTVSSFPYDEAPSISFSAAEKFFQQPSPYSTAQRIPSPWGAKIHRISTGSIPNLSVCTAQAPTPSSVAEITRNSQFGLSIASCSLINIKSNIKLYRRMAIKTHNKETQLTYAKYLMQISKLYDKMATKSKSHHEEPPSETRRRLLTEAGYWIERLAKAGQPEALYIQGRWYLLGADAEDCVIYTKPQESKAFKCFLRASKAGHTEAHYELAHLWKKKGMYEKAVKCYKKGAEENHTPSIYKMAKILLRGQLNVKRDVLKGFEYLKKAADRNDHASAEPAFVLGCIYANELDRIGIKRYVAESDILIGTLVEPEKTVSLALKYLKKSAEIGYPDAIYFMGQVSEKGILGQLCDSWQAYQYYMKAAEVDHAGAMLDLSRLYFHGISGLLASQKDMAFKWCKRSADLGFDQAEYVLGQYYEDGIGVAADIPRALEYYGKAASKGYSLAAEKLNRPLTGEPVTQGSTLVVASVPKVKHDDDDEDLGKHRLKHQQQHNFCYIQ